jgi:ACS family glucarate transporter-like MFS transporter
MQLLRRALRIRWLMLLFMFFFALVAYMQHTSLAVAAERIMPALHLSQMQVGWLLEAFTLGYTVPQLAAGVLGQRFGARSSLFVAGLIAVAATVTTPLAPMLLSGAGLFVALVLAQTMLGIAQSPLAPVAAGVVEAWFPGKRWAFANGLQSSGINVGTALTPPLIVLLTQSVGWQGALLWVSVPSLALVVAWGWWGRNTPREHSEVTSEELAELPAESRPTTGSTVSLPRLRRLLADQNVLLLAFSYLCMNYLFYLLMTWSFLYLVQERHFSGLESGLVASLPPIGAAIGCASGGLFADRLAARLGVRWGYRLVPLAALPLAGALLLLAMYAGNAYAAVAALTAAFVSVELNEGPYWAAATQLARGDTMAATGLLNTGGNLGGVVGTPIVAYLSGRGSWTAAFATGTAFALIAAGAWLLISADHPALREDQC